MQSSFLQAFQDRVAQSNTLLYLGCVRLQEDEAEFQRFEAWLDKGWHAGMEFLERHLNLRRDPRGLLDGAGSAIVFALPYNLGDRHQLKPTKPRIAQYARFRDYHRSMRQAAEEILIHLQQQSEDWSGYRFRVLIDSAPILERALAARTEKGFVGKNSCYIHPEFGSLILLGVIITDMPLPADASKFVDPSRRDRELGGCGSCRRCQVYCPTGALSHDYQVDANRCLAYWTIEHRGAIPLEFWPWLAHYWFGCDICQIVCPYNRAQEPRGAKQATLRPELKDLDLFEVAIMDQAQYELWFGGTPMTRAKRSGLRRNALIALAATNDSRLDLALAMVQQEDESCLKETREQMPAFFKLRAQISH